MNMKTFGRYNVRKHREIKNDEKYITLDISLKFVGLDNIKITYSEPKDYLGISGKGFITSLDIKTNVRSNKNKKARFTITNITLKYLSRIIREFEKFTYKGCVRKRPKYEPTDI